METIIKQKAKPFNSQCPKFCDVNFRKETCIPKTENRKYLT